MTDVCAGQSCRTQTVNIDLGNLNKVISFKDPAALDALDIYAELTDNEDLAVAVIQRMGMLGRH